MQRWGWVISGFYGVLVLSLFWPAALRLGGETWLEAYRQTFSQPRPSDLLSWTLVGLLVVGQAMLLFLTVETSWKRLKPRQHIWVSATVVGFFVAVLALALVSSVWAAIAGDGVVDHQLAPWKGELRWTIWLLGLWTLWGVVFYAYYRGAPARVATAVTWLLTASVLELLVAIPAHVIVRRREDCSAPAVTGFGIATGIAVMLACFGPGVLMLYKKRLERYRAAQEASR